jgi:hypothetical protein
MEVHHQPKTRSYRYIVYLVLAAIAAGISFYFYSPKPVNKAANKNMALFLQNAISDIDLKLKNGNEGTDLATHAFRRLNLILHFMMKLKPTTTRS